LAGAARGGVAEHSGRRARPPTVDRAAV